jgi:tetratricopeptide (TPR) repeat protein
MPYQKIALLVGALALVVGGVFAADYFASENQANGTPAYYLTAVADGTFQGELPPLSHEVEFDSGVPEDARAIIRNNIEEARSLLETEPADGNAWMDLALWYHAAGDYQAAIGVWEFIVSNTPNNITALVNLGRVFHFEKPDYPRAESYLRDAIAANPARQEAYYELFDLYRYSYKRDTTAAVDIVKEALKVFPEDTGFIVLLGTHYRDLGKLGLARQYFVSALEIARTNNNLDLVTTLNAELAKLP